MPTRRTFIKLATATTVVAGAYGGAAVLRRLFEPSLTFTPISGLPGFRFVQGGPVTGGASASVLLGIDDGTPTPRIDDANLCGALFGAAPDPAAVQIAYFTDYRCFYCRRVSPMLEELAQRSDIQVTWHDLPLLGQISTRAAQAAVAAREQGAYDTFHRRLMGTPVLPTPSYLRQLSDDAEINATQLLRDMGSDATQTQLRTTFALSQRFGFIGTPALVVGRTAVLGGLNSRMLERLINSEKVDPSPSPCVE